MPEGWRLVRLGKFLKYERREIEVRPDETYYQIGLRSWGKGFFHKEPVLGEELGNKQIFLIKEGDLVPSITFAWEGAIALASSLEDGKCGSMRFPTFVVNEKIALGEYILRFFQTTTGVHELGLVSPGGAGRNRVLNKSQFLKIRIPLPPINEQRRITAVLRDADANIAHVEAQIDAAREVKRGAMKQLFTYGLAGEGAPTQETKIGDIPQHWQIVRLRDVTSESKKRNSKQNYDGKQVLSVSNEVGFFVSDRELPEDLSRYKLVKHKYFGYNPMRLNVGSIAFREEPETGMISPDYVVFRCDEKQLAPEYLDQFRRSFGWERQIQQGGTGSVRIRYYYKDIALFFLPLPPYDEQCEIAAILKEHDHIIIALVEERDRLFEVKRGLMQQLLSGEVRV